MKYFLDTNIISYLMQKNTTVMEKLNSLIEREDAKICISAVTCYELKRGLIAANATTKLNLLQAILFQFEPVLMDWDMYERAAQIYADLKQKGRLIEDDDIFIGATALEYDAVLVTNNERHMGRIAGLRVEVWS